VVDVALQGARAVVAQAQVVEEALAQGVMVPSRLARGHRPWRPKEGTP
jgi:hypothetical protein